MDLIPQGKINIGLCSRTIKCGIWGNETQYVWASKEQEGNRNMSFFKNMKETLSPCIPPTFPFSNPIPKRELLCHLHGGDSHSVLYSLHHLTHLPALREEEVLRLLHKVPAKDLQQEPGKLAGGNNLAESPLRTDFACVSSSLRFT